MTAATMTVAEAGCACLHAGPKSPVEWAMSLRAQRSMRHLGTIMIGLSIAVTCSVASANSSRIKTTTAPVMIDLAVGPLQHALSSHDDARAESIKALAGQVVTQAQQPGSLLTLRLTDTSLTYHEAPLEVQREVLAAKGAQHFAVAAYESAVAALVLDIITAAEHQAGAIPISVWGLPVEGDNRFDAEAKSSNARYRSVINATDAFVATRSVFVTGGAASELMTLKSSLSEAFRLANGRPIVYRSGAAWRLVTTPPAATFTAAVGTQGFSAPIPVAHSVTINENNSSTSTTPANSAPASNIATSANSLANVEPTLLLSQSLPADAIEQLQAAWGTSEAQWDLNGDGVVNTADLALLLAMLGSNADEPPDAAVCFEFDDTMILPTSGNDSIDYDSNGSGDDDDSGGEGSPAVPGQWTNPPAQYVFGSGINIGFEVNADSPSGVNVVFQTWSLVTDTIEAPQPDYNPPFVYLTTSLDQVTAGAGEIQAIVRDGDNQVLGVVKHSLTFSEPDAPGGWDGAGGDGDVNDDGIDPDGDSEDGDAGGDDDAGGENDNNDDGGVDDGGGGNDNDGGGDDGTNSPGGGGVMPWGDPDAPAPQPVIHCLDASGMAPFAVHVHALDSQLNAGDALTAYYQWDFGDPTGQYNQLVGFNAAHIYEQPGTYTITLTITNEAGQQQSATIEVAVSQNTRMTFYVAANGNDSNNGLSSDSPVKTFPRALQLLTNDSTVLFRRGDVFDVEDVPGDITKHNWAFGAYGSASQKPKLRWTGGTGSYPVMIPMHPNFAADVVIQDIKFDSAYSWDEYDERNIVDSIRPAGTNITVRNCAFGNVTMGINSEREPVGVLGLNNSATTENGLRAYLFWVDGTDHTYLGNEAVISTHEHNVRLGGAHRVLLCDNTLHENDKRTIWVMSGEYCYVANNRLNCGRLTIGPNHAEGDPDDRFKWCVIERNEIDHTDVTTEAIEVEHGSIHVSLRSNIIKTYGKTAIGIDGWDEQMNRRAKDIRVLSNTAINDGSTGQFCSVGTGAHDLIIANNLFIAPQLATGSYASAIMFILESNLDEFDAIKDNCWPVPDDFEWVGDGYHYLWPYWSNAEGFQNVEEWGELSQTSNDTYENVTVDENYLPQGNCSALGMAQRVPGVYTDYHGVVRPPGAWAAGAVEIGD